jgi:hypothetical protein
MMHCWQTLLKTVYLIALILINTLQIGFRIDATAATWSAPLAFSLSVHYAPIEAQAQQIQITGMTKAQTGVLRYRMYFHLLTNSN